MCHLLKRLFHSIHPATYLALAVLILTVPISWVAAWLLAGAIHELGHYLTIVLLGKRVYGIRINWNSMVLETEDLGSVQWLCALAGPFFGMMLIPFYRWFPRLAVCALIQSGINLLPVFPTDGGRLVFGVLSLWLPDATARRITSILSAVTLILLTVVALYVFVCFSVNLFSLSLLAVILTKLVRIRFSCKDERLLVQ